MLRVCPAGVPSCRSRRPVVASSRPTGIDPPSSDRPAAACCRRRGREARGREPLSRWMLFAERLESRPAPTVSDRRSACRRRDVPGGDDGQTLRGELAARHRDRDGLPLRKERCLRIGNGRSRLALRFGQPDLWARPIERSPIASRQRLDSASIALRSLSRRLPLHLGGSANPFRPLQSGRLASHLIIGFRRGSSLSATVVGRFGTPLAAVDSRPAPSAIPA